MSLSREELAAYLHTQFSGPVVIIGQTATDDSAAGYGPDIDLAMRVLGVSRDDLATASLGDDQELAAQALADYFAARRIWRQMGDRANHTMGTTQFSFTDQRLNMRLMMDEALQRCTALGFGVAGNTWTIGDLGLDWVAPTWPNPALFFPEGEL